MVFTVRHHYTFGTARKHSAIVGMCHVCGAATTPVSLDHCLENLYQKAVIHQCIVPMVMHMLLTVQYFMLFGCT